MSTQVLACKFKNNIIIIEESFPQSMNLQENAYKDIMEFYVQTVMLDIVEAVLLNAKFAQILPQTLLKLLV